jgi:uroporphyrinogen-III decarboxylase
MIHRTVATPEGMLTSAYRKERYQKWAMDHLVKDERDLELLKYRPDPKYLDLSPLAEVIRQVGDRGLVLHVVPGAWYEACTLRYLVTVTGDLFERPAWLHRYLEAITSYLERLLARVLETGVQAIQIDESWVGVGLSPKTYNEFVLPYDRRLVEMAHRAGVLVDYHNCGRAKAILEPMADTGADVLEPLTPPALNGDTVLAEAKRRIGGRMALYGGFNERVLMSEDPEAVRAEVRRCLDEGAAGGGYAIRSAGQVFEADLKNIEIMSETVHKYGAY